VPVKPCLNVFVCENNVWINDEETITRNAKSKAVSNFISASLEMLYDY
jgi:hypothetical protein